MQYGKSRGARFFLVHIKQLVMDKKEEYFTEVLLAIRKVEYFTTRANSWSCVCRYKEAEQEAKQLAKASRELHQLLKKVNAPVENEDNNVISE